MSEENKMRLLDQQHEQSAVLSVAADTDMTKRRLVRGAVATAPVLLTLRSGALAALSCTPIKVVAQLNDNAEITATTPTGYTPAPGDACFEATLCGDIPNHVSSGTRVGNVDSSGSPPKCGPTGQRNHSYAILSINGANSLSPLPL